MHWPGQTISRQTDSFQTVVIDGSCSATYLSQNKSVSALTLFFSMVTWPFSHSKFLVLCISFCTLSKMMLQLHQSIFSLQPPGENQHLYVGYKSQLPAGCNWCSLGQHAGLEHWISAKVGGLYNCSSSFPMIAEYDREDMEVLSATWTEWKRKEKLASLPEKSHQHFIF